MTAREYELRRVQQLSLPPEKAFEFFADARNLEAITPPFLRFHITTPTPIDLKTGARIDYHLRLAGLPFSWRTVIEDFDPPRKFVDRQLRGPYAYWHHTHMFEPVVSEDGIVRETDMNDVVRYRLYLGPLGWFAHALWVRRTLEKIFDYRRERIAELIG